MTVEDMEIEIGPHEGWTRYKFQLMGRPWSLLTIDREGDRHSLLSPSDGRRTPVWPHYHIMRFIALLSPDDAVTVIRAIYSSHEEGVASGRHQKALEIRKVLSDD